MSNRGHFIHRRWQLKSLERRPQPPFPLPSLPNALVLRSFLPLRAFSLDLSSSTPSSTSAYADVVVPLFTLHLRLGWVRYLRDQYCHDCVFHTFPFNKDLCTSKFQL